MNKGYLCLLLHAHLPFIKHPEHEIFMEENWFFEGLLETYVPLLKVFEDLTADSINFKITLSISPSLCEMFIDPLLQERFIRRLNNLLELSEKELKRTIHTPYHKVAEIYRNKLLMVYDLYVNKYERNIVGAFNNFFKIGRLEIITCEATHGFLPLLNINENTINAQIEVAVMNFKKHFGRFPKGIWNSECAYYPGMEEILKKWGIRYFFVDTHGILYSEKKPKYGIFAPVYCHNSVAVFGRELESSKQVWSRIEGYPSDADYRDFYRDIGFDLPMDYIKPYLYSDGLRMMTGFKYHRITGKDIEKEIYDPDIAMQRARVHARDFVEKRERQIDDLLQIIDRKPIIVSPYDAELFGHWWFEGPDFINFLCREIDRSEKVEMIAPLDYLAEYPINQVSTPSFSSWGNKGYMSVWLNEKNDWIYIHIHECSDKMVEMANKYSRTRKKLYKRILEQMAREILLAQTSCWAFIISTGTTVKFAIDKIVTNLKRFLYLYNMLKNKDFDLDFLYECEKRDSIFPEIDFNVFSDKHKNLFLFSKFSK